MEYSLSPADESHTMATPICQAKYTSSTYSLEIQGWDFNWLKLLVARLPPFVQPSKILALYFQRICRAGVFGVAPLSSTSQASPNSILTYALRKNYHILHFKSELYLLLGNEANTDRNWVGGNIWLNYAHIYSTTSMNNNEHALVSPISCLCSRCWWRGSIVKHHIPHH